MQVPWLHLRLLSLLPPHFVLRWAPPLSRPHHFSSFSTAHHCHWIRWHWQMIFSFCLFFLLQMSHDMKCHCEWYMFQNLSSNTYQSFILAPLESEFFLWRFRPFSSLGTTSLTPVSLGSIDRSTCPVFLLMLKQNNRHHFTTDAQPSTQGCFFFWPECLSTADRTIFSPQNFDSDYFPGFEDFLGFFKQELGRVLKPHTAWHISG